MHVKLKMQPTKNFGTLTQVVITWETRQILPFAGCNKYVNTCFSTHSHTDVENIVLVFSLWARRMLQSRLQLRSCWALCSRGGQLKLIAQGLAKLLRWVFQAQLSNPWRCSYTGAASALSSLKLARTCLPRLSSHCRSRTLRCQLCQAESLRADSGFEFVFHSLSISCPLKKLTPSV